MVYVMPENVLAGAGDQEVSLRQLWAILWRRKLTIIFSTAIFAAAAVVYALLATEWYRADVLLAPVEERSAPSIGGQLGGLAALAGVTVESGDSVEAVATLESRDFIRSFIEDFDLLPILFADRWDSESKRWLVEEQDDEPDIRDAVTHFLQNVLDVEEDRQTGLVTLTIDWVDPVLAADWADTLVRRLNARLRERALREAEANVEYLQGELLQTSVVTLQQSISRLLESELQKLMLARGNEEFAFRIIDGAVPPKDPVRPKRVLVVAIGVLVGGMLGVFFVFLAHVVGSQPPSDV